MVFVATPVVALLKCCNVSKHMTDREYDAVQKSVKSWERRDEKPTILDTPLVRGERVELAEVGVRLDMVRNNRDIANKDGPFLF